MDSFATILGLIPVSTFKYPHADETRQAPAHQQKARRNRILVVEDNQLISKLSEQLLTAHGYEIVESPEGWQAIHLARDEQPDLILMDIRLPDISGLHARPLKQDDQTKTIPMIAVTALANPEYEKKSFESGCDAYIPKPIILDISCGQSSLLEDPARDAHRHSDQLVERTAESSGMGGHGRRLQTSASDTVHQYFQESYLPLSDQWVTVPVRYD